MPSIHYFQRYSQKENVVTNNTLLLLARLYETSTSKFQSLLYEMLETDNLEVGLNFVQQTKNQNSVPDGAIYQNSFKVILETKLGDNYNITQLQNHLSGFGDESHQFLLALGSKALDSNATTKFRKYIAEYNKENGKQISFVSTTFAKLIEYFQNTLYDYDVELNNLINDYTDFCFGEQLIPNNDYLMRLVLAGQSFDDNTNHNLYYHPVNRGFTAHKYIGLYSQKTIWRIGKVVNIVRPKFENGLLDVSNADTPIRPTQKENIQNAINAAQENRGWDIGNNHVFFCVEKFEETAFCKTTKYAPRGARLFDLRQVIGPEMLSDTDTSEIASLLKNKTWE